MEKGRARRGLSAPGAVLLAFLIGVAGFSAGLIASPGILGGGTGGQVVVTTTVTRTVTGDGLLEEYSGEIEIDGSSTVFPLTEAAAEAFMEAFPDVRISVGISGTGGGFKRFIIGEIDINDASRPVLRKEAEDALRSGVEWIEVPIAIDGLVVVVNRANEFVDCLSISELRRIWEPRSGVETWRDVRPEWPDESIRLYGPGPDSGTFDYFTERVVGKMKASRTDYIASEDDNVLLAGVEGEESALGYFGYAYYVGAKDRIRAVPIRDDSLPDSSCVEPSDETIRAGLYPLSRPLFIYVSMESWEEKPQVRGFVYFYLENAPELVKKVQYTPFPDEYYDRAVAMLKAGIFRGLVELIGLEGRDAGPL